MAEETHEVFGKMEIKPEGGFNLKLIERHELKMFDNVLVMKKDDNGIYAIKGVFKVLENNKDEIRLAENKEELGDPKVRKALAHAIVEMNKEALIQQSLIVTEEALARKSTSKLKSFLNKKNAGHKLELKTRVGCVYMKIGDEETVL